jgi:predicted Zn-dependent protease with MMP-like domain
MQKNTIPDVFESRGLRAETTLGSFEGRWYKVKSTRIRVKRSQFDALVESALRKIPGRFRDALENVEIVVEDWPDPDLMEEVTGDPDGLVYGLFTGKPITDRRFDDWGDLPSIIYLFRCPLEEDFPDPKELAREVEITLVHEIAHFMGLDEEILKEYGYD